MTIAKTSNLAICVQATDRASVIFLSLASYASSSVSDKI